MTSEDRERQFRVRPPKHRREPRDEGQVWSLAFKRMMHIARMTSRRRSSSTAITKRPSRAAMQRCAVRVTYTPNRTRGQWAAHGRYLARESAVHSDTGTVGAFGPAGPVSYIHRTLGSWQKAGDPRLFKLIISPEFGERADLEELTRDLMAVMEQDLGTRFEWVATAHYNTEHPHVHVALRGVTLEKKPVFFPRSYIQHAIRHHAEELTTAQLGPRTLSDAREAQRREVNQLRYTSLDRTLQSHHATVTSNSMGNSGPDTSSFTVDLRKALPTTQLHHLKARLLFLEKLGLVETKGSNQWRVRPDFETVLRAIAQTNDRQRALAAHRALLSDPRLPFLVTDVTKLQQPLEGRVVGHGEDESTGRVYMLLEGTDHHVHFIYHNREIEQARHGGRLQPNAFIRLRRPSIAGKLEVFDFGDANELLTNASFLESKAQNFVEHGIVPAESRWTGWLGKYEARLAESVAGIRVCQQRETEVEEPARPAVTGSDLYEPKGFEKKVLVGAEIRERNQPTARGLAESLMRAAAVSKRALGEHVKTSMAQTDSGIYLGEIIGQTDLHIVQRLSTRTAVAHMKHLLDSVPAIGSEASIVYSHHAAAVRGIPSPEREKGLSR